MTTGKKLSLFTFIDAFGWEILQRHSFLDDILTTKIPVGTIFGYSSTCDPTIITGKMPRDHGHFSFFYYNPKESPFALMRLLGLLPHFVTRRGRVRRVLSRILKRFFGYTGYFQIYNMPFDKMHFFDYSEKRDLYMPDGINSRAPTIFDYLRDNDIPFSMSDWRLSEEHNLETLKQEIETGRITFTYLYMAAMDAILHEHGTDSSLVTEKIRWYENQMLDVISLARKRYDTVNIYVFTDHGMTDITETCDLIPQIDRLKLKFGTDYAAVYDSTMARFWFLKNNAKEAIIEVLKSEPKGDILSDDTLTDWGCDFPNREYGELFFLMKPGVLLCPSFMGETTLAGMHGYDPYDKDSVAMLGTNVPLKQKVRRLDDLYDLMLNEVMSE